MALILLFNFFKVIFICFLSKISLFFFLFLFFFNLCSFSYFSEKLPLEYRISHNDVLVSYFKGKISQIFPFLHQFCRFLVSPIIRFFRCWLRHLCSLIY
jgi:hypothetical protein